VYSLIRPLRTGFRRIRSTPESVAVTRGAWHSLSGTRCAMPSRVVVRLVFGQHGAQMRLTENLVGWPGGIAPPGSHRTGYVEFHVTGSEGGCPGKALT
jgi:hypothetical protein